MHPSTGLPTTAAQSRAALLVAQGNAQLQAGNPQGAAQAFQQAIRLWPLGSAPYRALLELLLSVNDLSNAGLLLKAIPPAVYRQSSAIRFLHALFLKQSGQPDAALALLLPLQSTADISPELLAFHIGECHFLRKEYDTSLPLFARAAALGAKASQLYFAWARSALFAGDLEAAKSAYDAGCKANPDDANLKYELGLTLLKSGEFEPGFRLFQQRWRTGLPQFRRTAASETGLPPWDGHKPLRSLLVSREQGIGEQIVFSALLPALARKVPELGVSFDDRLAPLLQRTWPDIGIVPMDAGAATQGDRFAACVSAGDLGALLPGVAPWEAYLAPDRKRAESLRKAYRRQFPGKRLIGLSWRSGPTSDVGRHKTTRLLEWQDILQQPDCQFINLQYGEVDEELTQVQETLGVALHRDPAIDPRQDLDGLAAQMAALDLVITTSNTTAHLAAATQAATWVILPPTWGLLWYWGYQGPNCAWYPQARLFRAMREDDWTPVLQEVAMAMRENCRP